MNIYIKYDNSPIQFKDLDPGQVFYDTESGPIASPSARYYIKLDPDSVFIDEESNIRNAVELGTGQAIQMSEYEKIVWVKDATLTGSL